MLHGNMAESAGTSSPACGCCDDPVPLNPGAGKDSTITLLHPDRVDDLTHTRSSTMENLKTMLQGKKGLIVGIANDNSIAYGCARVLRDLAGWCRRESSTHLPG